MTTKSGFRRGSLRHGVVAATALVLLGGPLVARAPSQPAPARAPVAQTTQRRRDQNVIVILVDDMGFSDIGPYGSEIPTPNLDKHSRGWHSFHHPILQIPARCSPSRAALMTGLYPQEAGMGNLESVRKPEVTRPARPDRRSGGDVWRRCFSRRAISPAWRASGIWAIRTVRRPNPKASIRSFDFPGGDLFSRSAQRCGSDRRTQSAAQFARGRQRRMVCLQTFWSIGPTVSSVKQRRRKSPSSLYLAVYRGAFPGDGATRRHCQVQGKVHKRLGTATSRADRAAKEDGAYRVRRKALRTASRGV